MVTSEWRGSENLEDLSGDAIIHTIFGTHLVFRLESFTKYLELVSAFNLTADRARKNAIRECLRTLEEM